MGETYLYSTQKELQFYIFNLFSKMVALIFFLKRNLPEFAEKIQDVFPQPLKFNIYDTEFYSKVDGSLDFGRTRYKVLFNPEVLNHFLNRRIAKKLN
jgi:hypothetical protein